MIGRYVRSEETDGPARKSLCMKREFGAYEGKLVRREGIIILYW